MIVSAAITSGGVPRQAFAKARVEDRLAISQPIFDEIAAVLRRPALARFIDPVLRDNLLDQLLSGSEWFSVIVTVTDCRDAADNKYLELALASASAAIVSGDQDLLVLDPWRAIRILRPAAYLEHAS